AFINRGTEYTRKRDFDRAISDLNEAIRLNPNDARAFNVRGRAYGSKRDYDRSIADFNEAIRLDHANSFRANSFNGRGVAYREKGDYDRAITDFNEAIRLDPQLAAAFCNRGKAKQAIDRTDGDADMSRANQLRPSSCP